MISFHNFTTSLLPISSSTLSVMHHLMASAWTEPTQMLTRRWGHGNTVVATITNGWQMHTKVLSDLGCTHTRLHCRAKIHELCESCVTWKYLKSNASKRPTSSMLGSMPSISNPATASATLILNHALNSQTKFLRLMLPLRDFAWLATFSLSFPDVSWHFSWQSALPLPAFGRFGCEFPPFSAQWTWGTLLWDAFKTLCIRPT